MGVRFLGARRRVADEERDTATEGRSHGGNHPVAAEHAEDPRRARAKVRRGRGDEDSKDAGGDGGAKGGKAGNADSKSDGEEGGEKGKPEGGKGGKKKRWPLVLGIAALVLVIAGGVAYWWSTRNLVSTDDAYTEGRAVTIAPKVAGYVSQLHVDDNQFLRAGDLILRIDPRDYLTARDQSRANLALARAQLESAQIDLQIARVQFPANLRTAQAQLETARANQTQAQAQYRRQRAVDPRATTQTEVDTATATLSGNTASVQTAQAQLQTASLVQQNVQNAETTVEQRRAQVDDAAAQLAQAEVNLSYTEIRAPQDGRVTRRNVEQGGYLQTGTTVMNLVTPEIWVTANFKENQLDRMRPGQEVKITVDAYPDLELSGRVDSVQMGSGARFSAFPAENATGNFVKIVRRVPVKITIERGLDPNLPLPLGLSVIPTVTVR